MSILLVLFVFFANAFGDVLSCRQIFAKDQQFCYEIGQMLIIGFGGYKQDSNGEILWNDKNGTEFVKDSLIAQHIKDKHIGGVILFQKAARDIKTELFVRDRNIQGPNQVAKLNKELQNYNDQIRKDQGLESLPLFIGVDQEGGRIDRLPAAQGFPVATLVPQALGANEERFLPPEWASNRYFAAFYKLFSSSAEKREKAINETYEYAKKMGAELSDLQFNLNFFPIVDININPNNPIIGGLGRSFSSDPAVVVDQAKQFIKAFDEYKVISTLKHFPGHGSSSSDSHVGLVDVTDTYQKEIELKPYRRLIAEGYDGMIMTTHVINGQIDKNQCKAGVETDHSTWCPGTMSEKTLTGLLRDEMGFKGIILNSAVEAISTSAKINQ